jgi:hypothetical protein
MSNEWAVPGHAGDSDLARLASGDVAVLFERCKVIGIVEQKILN